MEARELVSSSIVNIDDLVRYDLCVFSLFILFTFN